MHTPDEPANSPATAAAGELTGAPPTPEAIAEIQNKALEDVAAAFRSVSNRMLLDHWGSGKLVDQVIDDQTKGNGARFGTSAIPRLADILGIAVSRLYHYHSIFRSFTEAQIGILSDKGIGISHVEAVVAIADGERRMTMLLTHAAKDSDKRQTAREFAQTANKVVTSVGNQKALDKQQGADGAPTRGGGVRSGKNRTNTGEGNPFAAVKKISGPGEKFADAFTTAIIDVGKFDPQSDKQHENFVKEVTKAAVIAADVIAGAVGFAKVAEEWLAANETNPKAQRAQVTRKEAYAQAQTSLNDFVKGYDKTLAAGAKTQKDLEDAREVENAKKEKEKEKAATAAKDKAAKEKVAKDKAAAKAGKPAKPVSAVSQRVSDIRARMGRGAK